MSKEIKDFFSTYTDFVTKVTSEPSIDLNSLKNSVIEILSDDIWNWGPEGLFIFGQCLRPYGLSINENFSKIELALCVSATVHSTLGNEIDFRTAIKNVNNINPMWEFN